MKLGEYIEQFVEKNSIIRLWYKTYGGHQLVQKKDWDAVSMEWEILKGNGIYAPYINHKVTGTTSILSKIHPEAINIIIEEIPIDVIREEKINLILDTHNE